MSDEIPKTLEECFTFLDDFLHRDDIKMFKEWDEDKVTGRLHHTLGRHLRNEWGLWEGSHLRDYFVSLGLHHADDMSGVILTSYHRYLNCKPLEVEDQVNEYKEYWRKEENNEHSINSKS